MDNNILYCLFTGALLVACPGEDSLDRPTLDAALSGNGEAPGPLLDASLPPEHPSPRLCTPEECPHDVGDIIEMDAGMDSDPDACVEYK